MSVLSRVSLTVSIQKAIGILQKVWTVISRPTVSLLINIPVCVVAQSGSYLILLAVDPTDQRLLHLHDSFWKGWSVVIGRCIH